MELILCFSLAVSAFLLLIGFIIGLVSAPTPILVVILIAGMMLTQKSISKFNAPEVVLEDKDKNRIESVEIAINPQDELIVKQDQQQTKIKTNLTSMNYRGFNYDRSAKLDKTVITKNKANILYRGVKSES